MIKFVLVLIFAFVGYVYVWPAFSDSSEASASSARIDTSIEANDSEKDSSASSGTQSNAATVFEEKIREGVDKAQTQLSKHRETFAGIIHSFEERSNGWQQVLEDGRTSILDFRSAIQEAKNQDAEFRKVYRKWQSVSEETAKMEAKFRELVHGAEIFYEAVTDHAESISDESLRNESLSFIRESEQSYQERLKDTRKAIEQVQNMKVAVDDTLKALEIRFAVEIIEQRIDDIFEQVDEMIDSVLVTLQELGDESNQLLNRLL